MTGDSRTVPFSAVRESPVRESLSIFVLDCQKQLSVRHKRRRRTYLPFRDAAPASPAPSDAPYLPPHASLSTSLARSQSPRYLPPHASAAPRPRPLLSRQAFSFDGLPPGLYYSLCDRLRGRSRS